jgi:hypothetical protein
MSRHFLMTIMLVALAATLLAEVPHTISYQGRLTNNDIPVNGLKSVTFTIYNGSGTPIWNSGITHIAFSDGLFTVELGQSPQTPLPLEMWPADTAMSLGVTIEANPELSPRLHFKTVPYAMHAMTAESAGSGSGWLHQNGLLRLEDPSDSIGIGTATPQAKVGITEPGDRVALMIESASTSTKNPALHIKAADITCAILNRGTQILYPIHPFPALFASNDRGNGTAAWFLNHSHWPALMVTADSGEGIQSVSDRGYGLWSCSDKGIFSYASDSTAIRAECARNDGIAAVIASTYTGSYLADHIAVSGYSRPSDYYGIGGQFEGGYYGVSGLVYPEGSSTYIGMNGLASGGSGANYGVYGRAYGGGTNVGVFGAADFGTANWAGYFDGDINVTGNIVKAASTFAIDHPTDPDNQYLQQAEVISNEMKAVYDGTVVLGSDGTAIVQLPDYLESFCGDFRYQLTCVGGYAPVYVSSEVSGNQFSISGGQSGLKVSWQITGIRKDKYAQANPLEVEKKKSAVQQGKYLHPELYGFGTDKSLSPNPTANAELKAKDDAVRAATEALKKPSTPPAMPQMIEKK